VTQALAISSECGWPLGQFTCHSFAVGCIGTNIDLMEFVALGGEGEDCYLILLNSTLCRILKLRT